MSSSSDLRRRSTIVRPMRRESDWVQPGVARARFDEQIHDRSRDVADEEPVLTFADGYNTGLEEGMALGRALAAAEHAAEERRLSSLVSAIDSAAAQASDAVLRSSAEASDSLVHAAFELAEAIIRRELRDRPRSGEEALRQALTLAPQHVTCVARLNPADAESLGEIQSRLAHRDVTVVADATVAIGDCVVDLPAGRIEARIDDAVDRARAALFDSDEDNGSAPMDDERESILVDPNTFATDDEWDIDGGMR